MADFMTASETPFPHTLYYPLDLQPLGANPLDLLQPIVDSVASVDSFLVPFNLQSTDLSSAVSNSVYLNPSTTSFSASIPSSCSSPKSASPVSIASSLSDVSSTHGIDEPVEESCRKRQKRFASQSEAACSPFSSSPGGIADWPGVASPITNAAPQIRPNGKGKHQTNLDLFNNFVKPQLSVSEVLARHKPRLWRWETLYTRLHQLAEPARAESRTSHLVAGTLRSLDGSIQVWDKVGGHGVVGMYQNGPGPVVALHAALDGVTINEETQLQYKCTRQMRDADLMWKPTMHASAHDMEIVCLLAATEALINARNTWSGTLVLIFQPDEEGSGGGAARMVNDGLFQKIGTPDVFLAQRVAHGRAGSIRMRRGLVQPAKDRLRVVMHGRVNSSESNADVSPISMAAKTVDRLEDLARSDIQREDPFASITIDNVVAGLWSNVRIHQAMLQLTVRSVYREPRERLMRKIRAAIALESSSAGAPLQPDIRTTSRYPSNANDEASASRLSDTFLSVFGGDYFDANCPLDSGCSSFPVFGASIGKPSCFWFVSGTDAAVWDAAVARDAVASDIPRRSSPHFAPTLQPTLAVGIHAAMAAALTFLTPVYQVT